MSINYLEIIKKAWVATWQNKYLWWFGFFVSLTSGGSFFNYSNSGLNKQPALSEEKILAFINQHLSVIIIALIALIIICLLLTILSLIGRGALIKSINASDKKEPSNFTIGFSAGKKYFWKILGLGFFPSLFIFAIFTIILVPIAFLFASHSYILGTILSIAGIAIFIPLIILVSFLKKYGQMYIILGELNIRSAIESSYALFRKNMSPSIIMALIFVLIGIIFGIGVLIACVPLVIIFAILGLVFYLIFKKVGIMIIAGIGIVIATILLLVLRSIYESFAQAVWVFFFHEIAKPKITEIAAETVADKIPDPVATPDPITFSEK